MSDGNRSGDGAIERQKTHAQRVASESVSDHGEGKVINNPYVPDPTDEGPKFFVCAYPSSCPDPELSESDVSVDPGLSVHELLDEYRRYDG